MRRSRIGAVEAQSSRALVRKSLNVPGHSKNVLNEVDRWLKRLS